MRRLRPFTLLKRRWRNCTREEPGRGRSSRCRRMPSAAASTKRFAACCRITWSFATAKSQITIRIRRRRGTPTHATFTERQGLTRMRCRTRRSSRRMVRTISRASTSCAQCGVSIPACRAACTCISATERCSKLITRRCLGCSLTLLDGRPKRVDRRSRGRLGAETEFVFLNRIRPFLLRF